MKDNGIVRGSKETAKPIIITSKDVYIHKDIEEVKEKMPDGKEVITDYKYHEYVYSKDEFLQNLLIKQMLEGNNDFDVSNINVDNIK